MKSFTSFIVILSLLCSGFWAQNAWVDEDWGFFAHRRINQLAVFTLPMEMLVLYRPEIEYIKEHAVDPDKRRYASIYEGIRHYIDLDKWEGQLPIDTLPQMWDQALLQYAKVYTILPSSDTVWIREPGPIDESKAYTPWGTDSVELKRLQKAFRTLILPQYYKSTWECSADTLATFLNWYAPGRRVFWEDHLSEHGVLPYHLQHMQRRLTKAFESKDVALILRLSAEMGHYIGDAHVPLHTSENYNGQLTNQNGIHAFWESRIPELFANDEYDFYVGEAVYFEDKAQYFWDIVEASHQLVDSVLAIERALREEIAKDQQMCFDERLGRTVLTQCEEFARAYQDRMNGMVENRMRASILAIGSSWYTAWVDAGQPDLTNLSSDLSSDFIDSLPQSKGSWIKRTHQD